MKVIELARKLKVGEVYIHMVMRDLSAKKGMVFTKKGRRYDLTEAEVTKQLENILSGKELSVIGMFMEDDIKLES